MERYSLFMWGRFSPSEESWSSVIGLNNASTTDWKIEFGNVRGFLFADKRTLEPGFNLSRENIVCGVLLTTTSKFIIDALHALHEHYGYSLNGSIQVATKDRLDWAEVFTITEEELTYGENDIIELNAVYRKKDLEWAKKWKGHGFE